MDEEVSEEEVVLEGSYEEWLDWRVVVEEQEAKGSSGTETRQAEDMDKTTSEGKSEAIAAEIPRFAKKVKTRNFSQFVPDSPGSQKLLTAQLVPDLPASQKLQSAQLVPELPSSPKLFEAQLDQSASCSSSQQPEKVKRERPGKHPAYWRQSQG